ncbi:MAG: formyltransferase family protein [Ferruginibacter sp.]
MIKKKIAIICQEDTLWALYAWNKVFEDPRFKETFAIAGFWNCEEKFYTVKKENIYKWYLNTFGLPNFIKLGLFTVISRISFVIKSIILGYRNSFKNLCKVNNLEYFNTLTPNSPEFIDWVKKNEVDVLIVMVGHILQKEILRAPAICSINKHAGLLPANKGVLPYFWARTKNETQGISFHIMNEKIDEGKLVYQEKVENRILTRSLVSFYFYSHKNYGKMLFDALRNLENENYIKPLTNKSSYHSLPTGNDYRSFRDAGGKIICWPDIFLLFKFRRD